MRITLGRKLLFYTSGIIVFLLLATFLVLERTQTQAWEDHLFSQSLSFSRLATPELLKQFRGAFPPDEPTDIASMHDFLALNRDLMQFSLVASSGRRLYVSARFRAYEDIDLGAINAEDLGARMAAGRTTAVTRHLVDGRRVLDLIEPAFGPTGQQILSVRYLLSYDSVDARVAELRRHFVMIALAAVALCVVLASLVARRMTTPIKDLTDGARAIARGELETRIETVSQDELGILADSFNDMSQSLANSQSELTRKNEELSQANDELLSMQAQLLRSERLAAIGQLAAGVSHEIDNPVGIILGHAELLLEDLPDKGTSREDVQAIIDECRRCKRITGGLLGFARPIESHQDRIDIERLIREVISSLQPHKLFKSVQLQFTVADVPVVIDGDPDQLRQVLINLLLNAAQAMRGHGVVAINLAVAQQMAQLTLDDSGPGVPEDDWDRVFQPFYSTKEPGEGTGLGLALCRKLIDAHGGEVVLSGSPQGGARFTVLLPLSDTEKCFDNLSKNSLG